MKSHRAFFVIVPSALLLVVLIANFGGGAGKEDTVLQEKRLVSVGHGIVEAPIVVHVGEVIEFRPFALAVTPRFLDARLKVRLEGDRVLEEIGQVAVPGTKEGRMAPSIFFLVREVGRTSVEVSVVADDKPIGDRYRISYVVESHPDGAQAR